MEKKTNRLLSLEGLRGVAAIIVVLLHMSLIFYPAMTYGPTYFTAGLHAIHFEDKIFGTPLEVFFSGAFAVTIFFILSGFVLSIGFFQTKDETIIKKLAAKRYIRLMLPALASVLIICLAMALGLDHARQAAVAITHSSWLANIWSFPLSLWGAITQGAVGIFTTGVATYNPVLWTMKYEFFGSFVVFAVCLLFKQSKYRWIIYAALLLGTYSSWYLGFVIGMILADLYALKRFPFRSTKSLAGTALVILGLFLGGYPLAGTKGTMYAFMDFGWMDMQQYQSFYLTLGGMCLVIAVIIAGPLARFFGSKIISRLGKYTFSLYLTHFVVLMTFCAGLFTLLHRVMSYNHAALLAALATIPVIIGTTYLFERYIDAPSIRLSGVFANWLLGLPQKEGATAFSEHPIVVNFRSSYIKTRNKTHARKMRYLNK